MSENWKSLPEDVIYVWRGHLTTLQDQFSKFIKILSAAEHAKANQLQGLAKRQFIFSRISLRLLLSRYLGVEPEKISFIVGDHGKLKLDSRYDISFNVSHSEEYGLFAFCKGTHDLGIDIEKVGSEKVSRFIVRKHLSASEKHTLDSIEDHEKIAYVFQLWTLKEAWAKATGLGISNVKLSEVEFTEENSNISLTSKSQANANDWLFLKVPSPNGFVSSICYRGISSNSVKFFEIPKELYS